MHIMYTYQITIFFHNKMVVLPQLYICKRYFLCGTTFGAYQNIKYIHMQHFCDVLVPYYKIVNLNFYYYTPNIALHGILFQNLL
jgi:hypothetical protein